MGEPGWPDFAFSTASTASIARVPMASLSRAGDGAVRVSGMADSPGARGAEGDGGGAEQRRAVVEDEADRDRRDERRQAALRDVGPGEAAVAEARRQPRGDAAGEVDAAGGQDGEGEVAGLRGVGVDEQVDRLRR